VFLNFKYAWYLAALTTFAGIIATLLVDPGTVVSIHWNSAGAADGFAPAHIAFFIIPLAQVITLLVFSALKYLEPRQENLEASIKAVKAMAIGVTGILVLAQSMIIGSAFGIPIVGPKVTIGGIGLLIAVMGNYFGKLKSSFFIGIRTPWTLSSETVWRKTHRLGGRLFMLAGIILLVATPFVHMETLTLLIMFTVVPATVISIVYSYILWRQERNQDV